MVTITNHSKLDQLLQIPPIILLQYIEHQRAHTGPDWLSLYTHRMNPQTKLLLRLLDTQQYNPEWIQYHTITPTWTIHPSDLQLHYICLQNLRYSRTLLHWKHYNPSPLYNLQHLER
jgi:hypothetical protein